MEESQAPTVLGEDLYDVSSRLPMHGLFDSAIPPVADRSRPWTDATPGPIPTLPGVEAAGLQRQAVPLHHLDRESKLSQAHCRCLRGTAAIASRLPAPTRRACPVRSRSFPSTRRAYRPCPARFAQKQQRPNQHRLSERSARGIENA